MVGLIISIVADHVLEWAKRKEFNLVDNVVELCASHLICLLSILLLIVCVILLGDTILWVRKRRVEFTRNWKVCKASNKLSPQDFGIRGYYNAYIHRGSNKVIKNLLQNLKNVLITGKPKIGKTRAAYEEVKRLHRFFVIIPRPENVSIEKLKISPLGRRNMVLFLDDLEQWIDTNINEIINRLKEQGKLIVVATCRSGDELTEVGERTLSRFEEFKMVKLEEITKANWDKLILDICKEDRDFEWKSSYDGTPGSATLGLVAMKERYEKRLGNDGKAVLKALKLLREATLLTNKQTRVKNICGTIFDLPEETLMRYNWDPIVSDLEKNGFVTTDSERDTIRVSHTSYVEECVCDYEPSAKDLLRLMTVFAESRDSGGLFYLGIELSLRKDFGHARECYCKALNIYPEYASAHSSLGYVLVKLGEAQEARGKYDEAENQYEEAARENREAIRINPSYAVNHNNLGYTLTKIGEMKEIRGERAKPEILYQEAIEEHKKAIEQNREYAAAHRSLAYVLGKLYKFDEAETEYRRAIELDPDSPFAHNLYGHLLAIELDRPQESEKEYREAIRLKADYPSAHNNLGWLLNKMGKQDEAEEEYRRAIDAFSDYAVAYVNLAHLLSDKREYQKAAGECRRALEINPDYAEAHNALGYALMNLKDYEQAEKEYRKAISIKPKLVKAHVNLGYLLASQGNHEKAAEDYRRALEINPDEEDALIGLGISLEHLSIYDEESENCYRKAISNNPNSIKARTTYGYFLSYRGREDEALSQFDAVIKIDSNDAGAHKQVEYLRGQGPYVCANRARKLMESGALAQAERECNRAITLNTANAFANKTLGILWEQLGDTVSSEKDRKRLYERAEEEYKMAAELHCHYPSPLRHLANLFAKLERYQDAETLYRKVENDFYNYPKNNRDFGTFLCKIGRKEEAKKQLELAIKLFENDGKEEEAREIATRFSSLLNDQREENNQAIRG